MGKPTVVTKPTPPETPTAKAEAEVRAKSLRLEKRGDEWALIEDAWASPPTSSRVLKQGARSVLGDYARLWHEDFMGTGRVGKLPL